VVFFKEEPLPDPQLGPTGAQGVPLTPGRSIAVDRDSIPLGTPVWLDATVPQAWAPASASAPAPQPLQRLVMAQDTGGAIVGSVRADYFWGWGDEALTQAGRTRQSLALWVLWPRRLND
jgi:membrane-bound lytic murein transglycosylase A